MKPAIFIPTKEDKEKAMYYCDQIIDLEKAMYYCDQIIDLLSQEDDLLFKAFVLQHLIDGFEAASGIDIKNGISIENKKVKQK